MSLPILHQWVAGPPWCRQYQKKYVYHYPSCITAPNSPFSLFSFYLASSFLYLPTLLPGAPIFLLTTTSPTTTFTTPTLNVTGGMTGEARYLRIVVSQTLAA